MAPIRKKIAAMYARPLHLQPGHEERVRELRAQRLAKEASTSTAFSARAANSNLKRQRRDDRREELLRKVQDDGIKKSAASKKRRRPQKKLVAAEDMDEMRDALPDVSDEDAWEGLSDEDEDSMDKDRTASTGKERGRRVRGDDGKIKMRSLQHRPGAMKRKRKMEGAEMDRFGRNLAQLSANTKQTAAGEREASGGGEEGGGGSPVVDGTKEKWAALRAFIGSTLETKKS